MRRTLAPSLVALLAACASASPGAPTPATPEAGVDAGVVADAGSAAADASDGGATAASDAAGDGADADAGSEEAGSEAGYDGGCAWGGAPGACMTLPACAALGDHSSFAGQCPGPATIECCITTPDPADNPPVPAGYTLMQQSQVTAEMTAWAVAILDDPATYPMFSTATKTFGTLTVLARVEWHPPDFQNGAVHRGVTLYVPG